MCKDHDTGKEWSTTVNGKCDKCIFFSRLDSFPAGKLPTKYEVLCYILTKGDEVRQYAQSLVWKDLAVLKISTLEDKSILSNTPIHNLVEERSVGMLNYELNLRGRNQFKTSSQNLVLNKSTDLIRNNF